MARSVLLVNPPYSSYRVQTRSSLADIQEPLGLSFLAGYLLSQGVVVEILDCINQSFRQVGDYHWQGLSEAEIEAEFSRRRPSVIAISSMFSVHCYAVHHIAALAKRVVPDAPVIVGGAHASAFAKIVASDTNVDLVVVGEGEQALHEAVVRHAQGQPLREIPGTAYLDGSGVFHATEPGPFLDLKKHPGPARHLLDLERYIATSYSRKHAMHARRLPVVTSRGCPYNCVFCSIHSVWRHSYHTRDPQAVLDEIEWLVREHEIREIMFWDDNMVVNRKNFRTILDGLIERRLNIRWCTPNGIAVWLLDEALIDQCRRSGCYKLCFGIETGSKKTQQFIRKSHIDLERTKQLIQYCNRVGIWTQAMFMIGFPFETREEILETINYAIDCGVDTANYKIAVPYPGSEMYDIYRDNGLLPDNVESQHPDRWIGNIVHATIRTHHLTPEELEGLENLAASAFRRHRRRRMCNPLYMARKLRTWGDIKYVARLAPWVIRQYALGRA